jgi:3-oxoacyl-[acyl-carrier protein] reductase
MSVAGKVALVTGASRGIGRSIAVTLAQRGAVVVATARGTNAQSTVDEIVQAGGTAEAVAAEMTDAASLTALVDGVISRHGRIDILVNNAGVTRDQLMLRMKRSDWDEVIATNLTAAFTLCQAALRPMLRQRSGRIIAISSVVGQSGNAGQANYAASKAGLIGLCKSLAKEVASRNITVNVVAPGLIETDMTRALTADVQKDWAALIPLGRPGTPADVASAVCFLASDEASYITGQVLAVNGGLFMLRTRRARRLPGHFSGVIRFGEIGRAEWPLPTR